MVFIETKCWKNICGHLVTLSIPKVVKNGQKVPILSRYEIRLKHRSFAYFLSLCDHVIKVDDTSNHYDHVHCKTKPIVARFVKKPYFWANLATFWLKTAVLLIETVLRYNKLIANKSTIFNMAFMIDS